MKPPLPLTILLFCCGASAQPPPAPLNLTLQDALERARRYSPQLLSAGIAAQIAREDTVQARAALLPSANAVNQFLYTQPNGTDHGVFVSNDGPHVYNHQAAVHGEIFAPVKRADYRKAIAAEALARARADVALRGLAATVAQNYYGVAAAQRKLVNAQQTVRDAEQFLDITQKQEEGGEVAHADVVKAQIQLAQRGIDSQNAQTELEKSRIAFGVLLFPDYGQPFTVTDDLENPPALPPFPEVQTLGARNNPDIRAAQAAVEQQIHEKNAVRAEFLPNLSFDYFYGINANEFAVHNREGQRNLGSAAQVQLTVPVWTWGANRSKVRQADLKLQQARNELTFAQRQLIASLNSYYLEAGAAAVQIAALRRAGDLSAESLRLTLLRYQAGEVTALEVVDAQSTLAQARNALAEGLVRYRLALAALQTLTGVF